MVLVGLDPLRDASTFAAAASLQREIEQLQASLSERRRAARTPVAGH